ncbi:hypothetical protein [Terrabacter terrigena]|uniref:Uncharacterized protein n=1 Tax=Terrabacter terrigena TaxID=574718 RepID=A0ABW3MWF1_9MICO
MTALAIPTETTPLTWDYFVEDIVVGEWEDSPGYELLYKIEHAGHDWITNRLVIVRADQLPPLESLDDDDRPTLTPFTPAESNEILARLVDPYLPGRFADTVEASPLFWAGLLAPLAQAGITVGDAPDARLPQPLLRDDEVVGLLMPFVPKPEWRPQGSKYVTAVSPFLEAAFDAIYGQGELCTRDCWDLAAGLENSGRFALIGGQD